MTYSLAFVRDLSAFAFVASMELTAQQPKPDPIDVIVKRFAASDEILEMEWRRDDAGRLQTRPKGSTAWQPLVANDLEESYMVTGVAGFLMTFVHGNDDVLGLTDGERHLRWLGIGTASDQLRTFAASPTPPTASPRDISVLDRLVAIDLLRRRGATSELTQIAALDTACPDVRERAKRALATAPTSVDASPATLDPKTLLLPTLADGYVVIDNRRVPDTSRLAAFGRHQGLASSMRVLRTLAEPTIADFTIGQTESDAIGELAFEVVRRLGNHRITHGVIAALWQPQAMLGFGVCIDAVGSFDIDALAKGLASEFGEGGPALDVAPGKLGVKATDAEFEFTANRAQIATNGMKGRARPELAAQLLATDAAIRFVLPKNSKAWAGLVAAGMPAATEGEISLSFVPHFVLRATLVARDEDAAEAWVASAKDGIERATSLLEGKLATSPDAPKLGDVMAALRAAKVRAEDRTVTAELAGKTFTWATLEVLLRLETE